MRTKLMIVIFFSIFLLYANPSSYVFADTELLFQLSEYYFSPTHCTGLDVGDIDNDGDTDIATVGNFRGDFIHFNNGADNFTKKYLGNELFWRNDVALVDFDCDGDLDFSWGTGGQGNINGIFEPTPFLDLPFIRAIAFADFNGDGYPDAVGVTAQEEAFIANNQRGQGFQMGQSVGSAEEHGVAVSDIDNDGDIDLAVGSKIWINNGAGIFIDSQIDLLPGIDIRLVGRSFADLNNDGYVDLVMGNFSFGCYVLINDRNGSFVWDGNRMVTSDNVAIGDINKDGFNDIVTSHPFCIYLNDGKGGFGVPAYVNSSDGVNAPTQNVEVADLNGDGYLDVILSEWKPLGFNGLGTPKVFYRTIPIKRLTCSGFMAPLENGYVKIKQNRTLPLKIQLVNDGLIVADTDIIAPPIVQITYTSNADVTTDVTGFVRSVGWGVDGNKFEYNESQEVWQFNLKLKGVTMPGTYTINILSGDETEYIIDICSAQFEIMMSHPKKK